MLEVFYGLQVIVFVFINIVDIVDGNRCELFVVKFFVQGQFFLIVFQSGIVVVFFKIDDIEIGKEVGYVLFVVELFVDFELS